MEEIILQVGQKYKIKGSIFIGKYIVGYTGMPNEQTFSIVIIFSEGYQSHAYNLFYPHNQKKIELEHGIIEVLHVNADSLRCKISKK